MYLVLSCLLITIILGISLARHNLKVLRETKEERLEARRRYKKIKNERLRKALGIPKREN
jgi:hypothetical protein